MHEKQTNPETLLHPNRGVKPNTHHVLQRGEWSTVEGWVTEEAVITVYVNGHELVSMMASPIWQQELAVGFLFNEGLIAGPQEVINVSLAPNRTCVDVWLNKELVLPKRRILTSGCGKGTTFDNLADELPPLDSTLTASPGHLITMMRQLQQEAPIHRQAGGVHTAGLATLDGIVMAAEDAGRHNTLDKLAGRCLLANISPRDHILLSTGRISSEMMAKARRMGIPIVASLNSPTSLSIQRARRWQITMVGHVRGERMVVYTHPERVCQLSGHDDHHTDGNKEHEKR